MQDIRFFIEFSVLEVMVVVSNQGAVHYLRREENYDFSLWKFLFLIQIIRLMKKN